MTFGHFAPSALVVDDQPFVAMVAADILKEAGIRTLHASDATETMELLTSHAEVNLAVVQADLQGRSGGVTLASEIRTLRPGLQLIVTTDGRQPAETPSGARVLRKPYSSAELKTLAGALTQLESV